MKKSYQQKLAEAGLIETADDAQARYFRESRPHEWTDERIRLGIAGCFGNGIVLREEAVFLFVKGVIADKDKRIKELRDMLAARGAALGLGE